MSDNTSHFKIEKGSARNFGIVFAAVFAVIAVLPYLSSGKIYLWAFAIAGIFCLAALAFPRALEPLNALWFRFGMLLGAVIAPVVMMLIYFAVVTPTGVLMRATGKDPLRLKKAASQETYWIKRKASDDQSNSMKNQF